MLRAPWWHKRQLDKFEGWQRFVSITSESYLPPSFLFNGLRWNSFCSTAFRSCFSRNLFHHSSKMQQTTMTIIRRTCYPYKSSFTNLSTKYWMLTCAKSYHPTLLLLVVHPSFLHSTNVYPLNQGKSYRHPANTKSSLAKTQSRIDTVHGLEVAYCLVWVVFSR